MVIGIFILTMGFNRTSVIQKMTSLIYRVSGGSFTKILTGFVLLAAGLAQLVPAPMLVFAIVYPLAEAMCHTQNILSLIHI